MELRNFILWDSLRNLKALTFSYLFYAEQDSDSIGQRENHEIAQNKFI